MIHLGLIPGLKANLISHILLALNYQRKAGNENNLVA